MEMAELFAGQSPVQLRLPSASSSRSARSNPRTRKSSISSFASSQITTTTTTTTGHGHGTHPPPSTSMSQLPKRGSISPVVTAPRPSSSSSRQSAPRKAAADFEAALLNPDSTIYLTGSPNIDESPEVDLLSSPPVRAVEDEADVPQVVEKRSYEEDLRALGRNDASNVQPVEEERNVPDISSQQRRGEPDPKDLASPSVEPLVPTPEMRSPQVIPPTPSTNASPYVNRRTSQVTMQSQDSGSVTGSPVNSRTGESSRRRTGPSLGLDAELQEQFPKKKQSSKRRSIFQRSPGTASSPDLATLVKKAKERPNGQAPPSPSVNRRTPSSAARQVSDKASAIHPASPETAMYAVGSISSRAPQMSPGSSSGRGRPPSRDSGGAGSGGSEDGWDRFSAGGLSSMHSRDRMPSIAESTSRQSDEQSKSLRNKAKGVFGKMFGATTPRDTTPRTSPAVSVSSTFGPKEDYPHPPVPPLPQSYVAEADARRRGVSPPVDAFGLVQQPSAGPSRKITPERSVRPKTPTPIRRTSDATVMSLDKPLPALNPDSSPDVSPVGPRRHAMHQRQPAETSDDVNEQTEAVPGRERSGSRKDPTAQFSKDVAGIFDNIGQTDPARELGLPPDSLREGGEKVRTTSMETAREVPRKFPADLSRSPRPSRDPSPTRPETKSPKPGGTKPENGLGIIPIPNRASSLPSSSPRPELAPSAPQRTTSSPSPSPSPRVSGSAPLPEGNGLVPPLQTLSRASSSSSKRSTAKTPPPIITSRDLGSPIGANIPLPDQQDDLDDFAQKGVREEDETIRARGSHDLPVLSPVSVRLVKSPRPDSPSTEPITHFRATSPWGQQTTPPKPAKTTTGDAETVSTPPTPTLDEESDEERGRKLACEFLEDDYSNVAADKVAMFLGGTRPVHGYALRYYMQYFDMRNQSLVEAFRDLCAKLYLKAESQEIDRILEGFSARYFECNPNTVFGTPGVVHTVTGAMLMLNTDLHIAELSKHMTRNDFVRNTLRTIREVTPMNDNASTPDLVRDDSGSVMYGSVASFAPSPPSIKSVTVPNQPNPNRSASAPVVAQPLPPSRTESERSVTLSSAEAKMRMTGPTGSSTTISSITLNKAWESEAEQALREIYSQVRGDKILLPTASNVNVTNSNRQSIFSISTIGSDSGRGKYVKSPVGGPNDRVNVLKRGSVRSVQGMLNNPYNPAYAVSDGRLSPTPSHATSYTESGAYAPTIGFASNLSHAVIREHDDESHSLDSRVTTSTADDDLNDDELALYGAPWAKEGMLWKRAGDDATQHKKNQKKDWKQYFVVVQRGELLLFTFGSGGSSMSFGAVGGGNWLNNANTAGRYSLVHSVSVAVPGGYSRERPYVFSVSLPSNQLLLLEAGTDDLVAEWIATCNYWSARRSRPALQGGVSNMEYGWARAEGNSRDDDMMSVRSGKSNMSKLGSNRWGHGHMPADRVHINDWKPPPPNLLSSQLDEENQLEALKAYVKTLNEELDAHKVLEEPMKRLYTPGSKNAAKAHHNFQLKSKFLVNEIYRYEGYIDVLRHAIALRIKKQGERKLEKSLARSTTSLHRAESEGNMLAKYMEVKKEKEPEPVVEDSTSVKTNGRESNEIKKVQKPAEKKPVAQRPAENVPRMMVRMSAF